MSNDLLCLVIVFLWWASGYQMNKRLDDIERKLFGKTIHDLEKEK
jgi:hypothetical protein